MFIWEDTSPPSSSQEKKPSLNHNFYDLCSCFFYYCSFLPHPLLLSTSSGTLQSLTQLHWSPLPTHCSACSSSPLSEFFLGSVHSYAHGLWLCTVEWFIRYCTLQQGLSSHPPMVRNHIYHSHFLTCRALPISKCIKFLRHSGGVLLGEPCFVLKSLLLLLAHLRGCMCS